MTFLSPIVLGGLAAAGVPVVIHLLNKFRVRSTDWGAMKFLAESVQKNQRRVKLDDLILLILRCLLVVLAVLAFARPVRKGLGTGGDRDGPVAAIILLDNSASMGQIHGSANRFDLAKYEIRSWFGKQDHRTLAGLMLVSSRTEPLIGKPSSDFGQFRKSLDDAALGDFGSDLVQGVRIAVESLKPMTGRPKEIRIYTDGQASAIRNRDELRELARQNPDIVIKPILVGGRGEDNLGIIALDPAIGIISVAQACRIRVEVLNSGGTEVRGVKVDLTMDDGVPAGSAIIPAIGSGETEELTIPVNFAAPGIHRIAATIPVDAFPADNQRTAAVEVVSRMDVMIVQSGLPGETPGQGGIFVARALVPVPPDQAARYYLAPQSGRPADLPAVLSQPAGSRPAVVFLCDPGPIPAAAAAALDRYVMDGGNLAVFPGEHSDVNAWSADPVFSKMLPATLAPATENQTPESWQPDAFSHPVTTLWNDPSNGSLGTVNFSRYCPMTMKSTGSPAVIAAFSDGSPSVAGWNYGKGTTVLFNSSPTPDWTNFPLHPAFVPFLQRLMGFFNRSNETRLNFAPGETFRKAVSDDMQGKDFSIRRPGSDAARTAGQVTGDAGGTFVRYSATDRAGAYQVSVGPDPVATFAVRMDAAESDLRSMDQGELDALADVPHTIAGGGAGLVVLKEYWFPLMVCAAVLFVAEGALAHRNSFAR